MARENEVKKCGVGLQFNTSKTKLMTMLKKEARRLKACVNLFFIRLAVQECAKYGSRCTTQNQRRLENLLQE